MKTLEDFTKGFVFGLSKRRLPTMTRKFHISEGPCLRKERVSIKRRLGAGAGAGAGVNFLTFLKTFTDSEKKKLYKQNSRELDPFISSKV